MIQAEKGNMLLGFGALGVGVVALVLGRIDRSEDQRQAQADLTYIEDSFRIANGYSVLTLQNRSNRVAAAITQVTFEISDPIMLRHIESKVPKPKGGPLATSANPTDDAIFRQGAWTEENTYQFTCNGNFHIKAGEVGDVRFKIINRKWSGDEFVGNLAIYYNGPFSPFKLGRVTVLASSR